MNTLGDAVPLNILVRIHEIITRARNLNVKTWQHEFSSKKRLTTLSMLMISLCSKGLPKIIHISFDFKSWDSD